MIKLFCNVSHEYITSDYRFTLFHQLREIIDTSPFTFVGSILCSSPYFDVHFAWKYLTFLIADQY